METRLIGSLTEIYVNGGGYLTENFPTRLRHFYKSKVLSEGETMDRYRDATEAEKQQWDAAHPADKQITMRTPLTPLYEAVGAKFNDVTGYYEFNGLNDITEEEMALIYKEGVHLGAIPVSGLYGLRCRTAIIYWNFAGTGGITGTNFLGGSWNLETIRFVSDLWLNTVWCFSDLHKLKAVYGRVVPNLKMGASAFHNCGQLEQLFIHWLRYDIHLGGCPKLSAASMRYLVDNAANTAEVEVTVHEALYAKLVGLRVFGLGAKWDTAQWEKSTTVGNVEGYANIVNEGLAVGDYVLMHGHPVENEDEYYFIGTVRGIGSDNYNKVTVKTLYGIKEKFGGYDSEEWSAIMADASARQIRFTVD